MKNKESYEEQKKHIQYLLKHNATIVVKKKVIYDFIKRLSDIFLSIIIFPVALILIIVFGLLIKIETPGPIFYSQIRVGKNGKFFKIYKLRSMYEDAEKNGAQWAIKDDPRITKVGKFIRKTRIDELPQLINIIKGDLSFIGPRPERPELIIKFSEQVPNFIDRNLVKPGLTGLAQVNGGYEMSPQEKLKWDVQYIKQRSILLDINILLKTVWVVFSGDGAY